MENLQISKWCYAVSFKLFWKESYMISLATLLQFGLFLIALLMLVIKIAELAQKNKPPNTFGGNGGLD